MIRLSMHDGTQTQFGKVLEKIGKAMQEGEVYQPDASIIVEKTTGSAPKLILKVELYLTQKLLKDLQP